ncbi:MAG TPA: nucleotidyl transferase AbiEii/AbiGii toxin family protein [Candidatus Binatia bacterium]|nr:nucleotidyl transferase AbiEii/AbiGii toxin family protein [Candidatus Binatia bacterium]
MADPALLRLYNEDPIFFREAVRFTAAQTGFVPRLIEKDYFCTVVLEYLSASAAELVFRGGTCLAKIHAEFYRLSEDLDFTIPTRLRASRAERTRLAAGSKRAVAAIGDEVPGLRVVTALTGANDSSQYTAIRSSWTPSPTRRSCPSCP